MKSSQHHVQWLVAAGLVSGFMWWLAWNIVQAWSAGVPGFRDVVDAILAKVGGS